MLPEEFGFSRANTVLSLCAVEGVVKTTEFGFVSAQDVANPDNSEVWFFIHTNVGRVVTDGELYYHVDMIYEDNEPTVDLGWFSAVAGGGLGLDKTTYQQLVDGEVTARYRARGYTFNLNDRDVMKNSIQEYIDKAK